ncbi:MAG: aminotransferase class V-fold PLP-dependent enzyme [Candidatus Delongbacteria bacterium]|jgi:selenocysteine lyase/cysteine desulfurase|nr:aminotransferase class V-fold PLP-dependent enzyme [Candidatus Delongbacteria bacterium]
MKKISLDYIRQEIIGNYSVIETPYGERNLFYADYTASGRNLYFIEEKLINIEKSYANTHTTDDYTGKYLTNLFHQSEENIKQYVNAGKEYKIISTGSGSTGALKKLQEIFGVYIPPATQERIYNSIKSLGCEGCNVLERINQDRPVVFIGPFEHHTNELMWREAFAELVVVELGNDGLIDMRDLRSKLSDKKYKERIKICSISAGSNITGILSDPDEIARIAHKYGAYAFFDFAAIAPYVKINMQKDKDNYYDAIFFSPHKFLGGPGSAGVLIFHEKMYRKDLPPTTAGGGTVDYVGYFEHDYSEDIETREKAGTPPILQTIKTALAMETKEKIGVDIIEEKEEENKQLFFSSILNSKKVEIIGNKDPEKRIPIISFMIKHLDRYIHPRLVTRLLSDLFGIQSRAGCSCAGPYGHRLLNIDLKTSDKYRRTITKGVGGVKPGWSRINLHYVFTKKDINFLINAINFIAEHGEKFLLRYKFDIKSADWVNIDHKEKYRNLNVLKKYELKDIDPKNIEKARKKYFTEANKLAEVLKVPTKKDFINDKKEVEELKYFYYCLK